MASSYLNLHVHVVFATEDRVPCIVPAWRSDLHAYLGGVARGLGAAPLRIGGVADHVHLLLGLKAVHSVASLVREIKKGSVYWARERHRGFGWQSGYAAFSVGRSEIERVARYIANQEEHHRKVSPLEELLTLLREEGVEFDERYAR